MALLIHLHNKQYLHIITYHYLPTLMGPQQDISSIDWTSEKISHTLRKITSVDKILSVLKGQLQEQTA